MKNSSFSRLSICIKFLWLSLQSQGIRYVDWLKRIKAHPQIWGSRITIRNKPHLEEFFYQKKSGLYLRIIWNDRLGGDHSQNYCFLTIPTKTGRVTFMDCLLWGRHCFKGFMCINLFNFHRDPMRQELLLLPFCRNSSGSSKEPGLQKQSRDSHPGAWLHSPCGALTTALCCSGTIFCCIFPGGVLTPLLKA